MVCQCQRKQKLQIGRKNMTKAYKIDLEIKGQHLIGNMNKYGNPMSNQIVRGLTRNRVKNPINLNLRSKFKVGSGLWMYETHRFMVIHPCASYGKPTSYQKTYGPDTYLHRQADRQTDRQSVIPINTYTPWTSFMGGGGINICRLKKIRCANGSCEIFTSF